MSSPSPVTPDTLKALLPSAQGSICEQSGKAWIGMPSRIWQLVNWLLGSDGLFSADARAAMQMTKPGDYIFSAAPLAAGLDRLLCNGDIVSRTTYANLFAAIGTTYGVGDGIGTFGLPNFTDRFPVAAGGLYAVGNQGGNNEINLTEDQNAPHAHHASTFISGFQYTFSGGDGNLSQPPASAGSGQLTVGSGGGSLAAIVTTDLQPETDEDTGADIDIRPKWMGVFIYLKT